MMCVECGRDVPGLIGGSCPDCFVKKTALVTAPQVLDVELCSHCDARHVGAHWIDPAEGVPLEWIRQDAVRGAVQVHEQVRDAEVELKEKAQDEKHFVTRVTLRGRVEGTDVATGTDVLVRMRRSNCDRCSRMFGGFYAAIIQLRATQRDVTEHEIQTAHRLIGAELDRLRATGNREAFLTKSGEVPGGFDYYLGDIEGTRAIARVLAERLGATVQEHAKLSGRKEGNDIYRVTFLTRIRLFAGGDFGLLGEDQPVQFQSLDRGKAIVVDLATHKRTRVDEADLHRLGGPEILHEALVISHDAHNLQLLDPVSLRTVDVGRPEGFEAGPSVKVLRHEERLYIVLPRHQV